jgi:hypothetical protein
MNLFKNTTLFSMALIFALCMICGCAWNLHPIDVSNVQSNVVKGVTTTADIEKTYGKPYNAGISKDGTSYYYYLSANPVTGASQDFTFYFDKDGKVASYATEYPTSNPLTK